MRLVVIASIPAIYFLASLLSVHAKAFPRNPIVDLREASGCAGWREIEALHLVGANQADGLSGSFDETLDARTGRFIRAGTKGGFTWTAGFDGAVAWKRDFSGASHPFDAPSARARARTDAWLARRGWCHDNVDGAQVISLHVHDERERTFDVLSVVPRGGSPVQMWIDRRTHLLDRIEEQLNESRLIEHYDDWRHVAGTEVPFVLRDEYPEDNDSETFTLREVTLRSHSTSSAFAEPTEPKDVVMLHGASMTRIPYIMEGQKPIVEVSLNGMGPFPFVLDTGAHFILTPATVRRIGVAPRGSATSTGQGNGILKTSFTRIRALRIGDAVVANDVAKVVPYQSGRLERGPRPPKAGWLGLSLFERFAVTIDPISRTVTLRPLRRARPRPPGARISLNFDEDAPLIACSVDRHRGPCMIDTGNAGSTIVEGYWAQRNALSPRLKLGVPIGDGIMVSRATLAFGPIRAPHELVEYQPPAQRGSEATTVEAAILSEGVIGRYTTTIDYDRHAMWLEPIPHPYTRPFNRSGIEADKQRDGNFIVWWVIPNSPASGAGIRAGTRILGVDGIAARDLAGSDFSDLSLGRVGAVRTFRIADGPGARIVTLRLRELLP